jgi:tRNA dimethylallyltransferase
MIDRQALECALYLVSSGYRCGGVLIGREVGLEDRDRDWTAPSPAKFGPAGVDERPIEPGVEALRIAQCSELPPGPDDGLLERVFRRVRVPQDARGDGGQPIDVRPDEGFERVMVAVLCPRDEVAAQRILDTGTHRGVLSEYDAAIRPILHPRFAGGIRATVPRMPAPAGTAPPLLVIAGATATGKTGLAIEVATALRGVGIAAEIISADSRQVFRGLDIGTAKAPIEARAGIPHHGLDLVEPDEPFSVVDFVRHARGALESIDAQGGIAILVGGTGLYLRAVARGLDADALPFDSEIRAGIEDGLTRDGLAPAVARLRVLAPTLASRIDLANPRRVARALEIAALRGDAAPPPALGYPAPVAWVGLRVAPPIHRVWIANRAREQFHAGLIEEARALRERFDPALPAFSAIGYREAWAVLDGGLTREQAIELDAQRNVAFAKRQATWFRSEAGMEWVDVGPATGSAARDRILGLARELVAAE